MTQLEKTLEHFALMGTPSSVWKRLKEEYGEDAFTFDYVKKIRNEFKDEILKKRKNISRGKLRILDPEERWAYLQEIIDSSLAGEEVFTKFGTYTKYDRATALKALQMADELSQVRGVVKSEEINQEDLVRDIVFDMFNKMKNLPEMEGKSPKEIVDEMRKSELSETMTPVLDEILEIYELKS
jgi:hypothetical protein